MAEDPRESPEERYLNRPVPVDPAPGSGVPEAPAEPPRAPSDPPDADGVTGDEGGGPYPGPPERVARRAR